MPEPLEWLVLVLPGRESERPASLESVAAEGVAATRVLETRQAVDGGLPKAERIAFIRPGDRWRPGCLGAHRSAFAGTPAALLSSGRHRRLGPREADFGEWGLSQEPIDPAALALRCPIEASAAAVAASALTPESLEEMARPGGDVALWCACAEQGPIARVEEVAAEVSWDRGRHGYEPQMRIEALRTLSRSAVGRSGPAAAAIRRELLARMFLEGGSPPDGFDASELAGDDGLRGVVADLQWTLERQGRQLAALRDGWPHAPAERNFARLEWPEDMIVEMTWQGGEWATERGRLDARIQALTARVREREAYIRRLSGPPSPSPDRNTES